MAFILRKIYTILILGATSIQKSFLIYFFFFTFLNFIFAAQGLCLVAVRRLSLVVVSRLWDTGSVVVAHGRSCSGACGILPDQGSNLGPCIAGWILNHWTTRETCLLIFNKTRHVLKNSQPCSGWRTMLWLENGISSFPIAFHSISTIKIICIKFSLCPIRKCS